MRDANDHAGLNVALQNADPARFLAELDAKAERCETPCGDGALVWRIWGTGKPLVLAHGGQGSWTHWVRNIEHLAQHRRLIIADLPGHGDSSMPAGTDHQAVSSALAQGLEILLAADALPADLCGFSFGGVALAYMSALYPHLARKLILVGCGGLGTPLGHPKLGRISGLKGEDRRAALKTNLLGLMLHDPKSADELAIHMLLPTAKAARLDVLPLVLPDRLLQILPDITAPVDAIWGDSDLPHPNPAAQEAVLRSIQPNADFRVIANAGHWVMYEKPAQFDAALLDILAQPLRQTDAWRSKTVVRPAP